MIIIDNSKTRSAHEVLGQTGDFGRFVLSPDIFFHCHDFVIKYGYGIAIDKNGNELFTMCFDMTTYIHSYKYTGELDLSLLNSYDCLVLYDCNDHAIELYLAAINQWQGKRLIFVGKNWTYFLDILQEYPGIEYFYEQEAETEQMAILLHGYKYLNVIYGHPHAETLDRYEHNILYYDEVMFFTFLFSDKHENGNENKDKNFMVIDARYGNLGLFALYYMAIDYALYVKSKGFIPIFNILNINGSRSIYQDFQGDEIWNKFFAQPEGYSMEDIKNSKNVYFAPIAYNARIISHIMSQSSHNTSLSWPNGHYSSLINDYITQRENDFLPFPEKTLGVLVRGTDYVNAQFDNHPVHASKEKMRELIEINLKKLDLKYIYLATEDENYCKYFKDIFGDKIYYTDQERFSTKENELLSEMHRNNPSKRAGFTLGAEYLLSILLLSRCHSLIASGTCTGLEAAKRMNENKYNYTYIYEQ
ncbi:MAG: hypothetical protein K6G87_06080 [Butyrivibrio sp.]|uniref:hypothetical protein n=1 Tax=Butyrivibrio sp. TaxID=28121 RepID=UPI0025F0241E|nr:hypothetical protein [Butyrivibrio sp.]MCR5770792.1 hypothetical protein [Butyrivibrio sp.]